MKAVILAGGIGSRLSEETYIKPKPMVDISNRPIIWHIMKYLSLFKIKHFIICCGYKGEIIKDYFLNYQNNQNDIRISFKDNTVEKLNNVIDNWTIDLIDTGQDSLTGGRLKLIDKYLGNDEHFLMTYGDGLADININELIKFSRSHSSKTVVTAVQPDGRYGSLKFNKKKLVSDFFEKPKGDDKWINGGYFIIKRSHLKYIKNLKTAWEDQPLKKITKQKELVAYQHKGFWKAMDTLSDKNYLENLVKNKKAPWIKW